MRKTLGFSEPVWNLVTMGWVLVGEKGVLAGAVATCFAIVVFFYASVACSAAVVFSDAKVACSGTVE